MTKPLQIGQSRRPQEWLQIVGTALAVTPRRLASVSHQLDSFSADRLRLFRLVMAVHDHVNHEHQHQIAPNVQTMVAPVGRSKTTER